jgi:hypothetical protein
MAKTPNPKEPMIIGNLRPYSSEKGAHIIGPNAYPRTKSEVPSVPTSIPTWYSSSTLDAAGEKILLPKVADNEAQITIKLMCSLARVLVLLVMVLQGVGLRTSF